MSPLRTWSAWREQLLEIGNGMYTFLSERRSFVERIERGGGSFRKELIQFIQQACLFVLRPSIAQQPFDAFKLECKLNYCCNPPIWGARKCIERRGEVIFSLTFHIQKIIFRMLLNILNWHHSVQKLDTKSYFLFSKCTLASNCGYFSSLFQFQIYAILFGP